MSFICENCRKLYFIHPILCGVKVLCYQYYTSPLKELYYLPYLLVISFMNPNGCMTYSTNLVMMRKWENHLFCKSRLIALGKVGGMTTPGDHVLKTPLLQNNSWLSLCIFLCRIKQRNEYETSRASGFIGPFRALSGILEPCRALLHFGPGPISEPPFTPKPRSSRFYCSAWSIENLSSSQNSQAGLAACQIL